MEDRHLRHLLAALVLTHAGPAYMLLSLFGPCRLRRFRLSEM